MMECGTLVYGATFWGIGYAAAASDVFVIDPGINPGHEFADTFCTKVCRPELLKTDLARAFYDLLFRHGAIAENRLHPAALVPALCTFILEHKLNLLLDSTLIDSKNPATVMTGGGKRQIKAQRLIDTLTPSGVIQQKSFNALLHSETPAALQPELVEKGWLSPGRFASEAVLHFPVPQETGFPEARKQLETFWRNRPETLQMWKIAATAQEFCYRTGACGFFSQGFGDPLLAMDSGIMEALK